MCCCSLAFSTDIVITFSYCRNVDVAGSSSHLNSSSTNKQASHLNLVPSVNSVMGNPYSSFSDDRKLSSDESDGDSDDDDNSDDNDDDDESRTMDAFGNPFKFGDR